MLTKENHGLRHLLQVIDRSPSLIADSFRLKSDINIYQQIQTFLVSSLFILAADTVFFFTQNNSADFFLCVSFS